MATISEVTLLVCASGTGLELRDIWRIVRRPGEFRSMIGDKKELESVTVLKKSLMPDNMAEVLTVKELHDLFAFLMTLE